MNRYTAMAAASASAAALAGAGALLVPAVAGASTTSHTMTFVAVVQGRANFSRSSFGEDDKNMRHGKVVGFDVIHGRVDPTTHTAHGQVALSARGGMMFGTLRFSNGPITRGRVTGGTGRFAGATGTIYAKSLNKADTRTAVTIHWMG